MGTAIIVPRLYAVTVAHGRLKIYNTWIDRHVTVTAIVIIRDVTDRRRRDRAKRHSDPRIAVGIAVKVAVECIAHAAGALGRRRTRLAVAK
jgi:hypothetical protein